MSERMTMGQRWAARFANLFASWLFLLATLIVLNIWAALNSFGIIHYDPELAKCNLSLSELTYFGDIIIIMNQIRQGIRDRLLLTRLVAMETAHGKSLEEIITQLERIGTRIDDLVPAPKRDVYGRFTKT